MSSVSSMGSDRRVDHRKHPELYRIGRGEQGVLLVEPYKSELLPLWRFRTPGEASRSAAAIYERYLAYRSEGDFVGMDMARKYLQMGFSRSRRYANHRSGRKFGRGGEVLPPEPDEAKAASAAAFYKAYRAVLDDEAYKRMRRAHLERYQE